MHIKVYRLMTVNPVLQIRNQLLMDFADKLKKICTEENINLKQFSELTNISYGVIRNYAYRNRTPSHKQILKIVNTPQFVKYKNLLLSTNEPIGEDAEFLAIWNRLQEVGMEDEALDYLRYLLEKSKKP